MHYVLMAFRGQIVLSRQANELHAFSLFVTNISYHLVIIYNITIFSYRSC